MLLRLGTVLLAVSLSFGCSGNASASTAESRELQGATENEASAAAGDVGDTSQAPPARAADAEVDAGPGIVSPPVTGPALTGELPIGSTLRTTTTLNMRTGPGTSNGIRLVLPEGSDVLTVNTTTPENGWYNISFNGVEGWSSGKYLERVVLDPDPAADPTARDLAVTRAKAGVGFSYWWGHGRWIPNGATSSNIGTCTGSCPNCTHTGGYGADCSGYVGKIWRVPSSNTDPTVDSHPYSTSSFNGSNSQWLTVDRTAAKRADAFVYNVNGSGHIFLYESGDGWGSMWAYEARGCSYGIVHNLRTAGSSFKAIARVGY